MGTPTYSEKQLNEFAEKEWKKILSFLRKQYSLGTDDCKDIFQESFIILYNNITSGKLQNLTSSLSTYFIGICCNKAHEFLRRKGKNPDTETSLVLLDKAIMDDKRDALLNLENDTTETERKEALVRQIVRDLPWPCNEMLWGFFRDNLNMKTLAEIFGYNSENSVKVTKHRCQKKFTEQYNKLKKNL